MAKGLRSSIKKSNRSKLRARVFGPVEAARNERLSAKLLELAQQPKPERPQKSEMEVDSEGTTLHTGLASKTLANTEISESANAAVEDKEDDYPKGSCFLTAPIPASLMYTMPDTQLSTQDDQAERGLYHLLGLSSDILGFTTSGDLKFAFDPLPSSLVESDHGLTASV
jgi:hypothetical protein